MEPPGVLPPDRDGDKSLMHHPPQQHLTTSTNTTNNANQLLTSSIGVSSTVQQGIERLSRPMAFDKMESLVREMQDSDIGVPVRSQKLFLTSIPSAFMGYDLIEWLMERLGVEESEALNISNQLCQHGYFFPVSDTKTLVVKDDSSLYRFQTPYYWPWQQKAPDNIEYAIYLAKRSLRNKQRHGLDEYEAEALSSLHKNLKGKWDFITMQAEEQVRLAKERKKGDKIVGDSQERAYWRVQRPPPGQFTPLEPCPIPSRDRQGKPRRRTVEDWQREVDILKASLGRNRVKMSAACESLVQYHETFCEYDPLTHIIAPSNPWVSEDVTFWQLNSPIVEIPTEKRVRRWGISIEEAVSDPTGLQEFTLYLKKEYSHENIRFWMAVNDLRRSSHSQISKKVKEIFEEFLAAGAPCEINIDGKTMEKVLLGLKSPSRFAFDSAAEHVFALLLKKDCYPRFIRSEHYKSLLANAIQPMHKKRFFGFGGGAKKKGSTATAPNQSLLSQAPAANTSGTTGSLTRRRGSDRSLSGSAHELAVSGVKDNSKVPHSHSQSNLSDIPYREPAKSLGTTLEVTMEASASAVCPWDVPETETEPPVTVSVCPWEGEPSKPANRPKTSIAVESGSSSSDISEVSERMKRSCGLRQNTLDGDFHSTKRLGPVITEQRRASMTMAPRLSDLQFVLRQTTSSPQTSGCLQKKGDEQSTSQGSLNSGNPASFEEKDEIVLLNPSNVSDENLCKNQNIKATNENLNKNDEKTLKININDTKGDVLVDNNNSNNKKSESKLKKSPAIDIHDQHIFSHPTSMPTISVIYATSEDKIEDDEQVEGHVDKIIEEDENDVDGPDEKHQGEPRHPTMFTVGEENEEEIALEMEECSPKNTNERNSGDLSPLHEEDNFSESLSQQNQSQDQEDYDMVMEGENLVPGCVAPAPTPAPSIAPLAEVEVDPADDEPDIEIAPSISTDDLRKKRKREKKDREKDELKAQKSEEESDKKGNSVCPWDDDDESAADDAPYVKTYSTLGYL